MIYNLFALMRAPKGETEYPIGEASEHSGETPRLLERWGVWVSIVVILILVAYTIPFIDMFGGDNPGSPGFKTW